VGGLRCAFCVWVSLPGGIRPANAKLYNFYVWSLFSLTYCFSKSTFLCVRAFVVCVCVCVGERENSLSQVKTTSVIASPTHSVGHDPPPCNCSCICIRIGAVSARLIEICPALWVQKFNLYINPLGHRVTRFALHVVTSCCQQSANSNNCSSHIDSSSNTECRAQVCTLNEILPTAFFLCTVERRGKKEKIFFWPLATVSN